MLDSGCRGVVASVVEDAGAVRDVRTGVGRDALKGFEEAAKMVMLLGCCVVRVYVEDEIDDILGVREVTVWLGGGVWNSSWDEDATDVFNEGLLVDASVVVSGCLDDNALAEIPSIAGAPYGRRESDVRPVHGGVEGGCRCWWGGKC